VLLDERPLYVCGVARAGAADAAGMPRLDGKAIRSVAEDGVGAFVSDAPSGAIETTRERLLTHARVLEHLAAERTVLPMRFGVVAPSERALREGVLSPRRKVFATLLDRLEGTVEVDLRVLYDEAAVLGEIVRGSPAVRRLQLSIRNRPADATYYDRIRLGETVAQEMSARGAREADRILAKLEPLVVEARRRPSEHERSVLHAALLVRRADLDRLDGAVKAIGTDPRFHV